MTMQDQVMSEAGSQSQTRDFDDHSVGGTASKPFFGPDEANPKRRSSIKNSTSAEIIWR